MERPGHPAHMATAGAGAPVRTHGIDEHGHIVLEPGDPAWPAAGADQRRRIRAALGDDALLVEHVGSTSVPGLVAKPVIDVVLGVADPADEAAYVGPLEAIGYVIAVREPDWFEHRCLRRSDPAANLHVFAVGCPEIDRMVLFRDRLRASPEDREIYRAAKTDLAARRWGAVQDYADAKTDVVAAILARADAGRNARRGRGATG